MLVILIVTERRWLGADKPAAPPPAPPTQNLYYYDRPAVYVDMKQVHAGEAAPLMIRPRFDVIPPGRRLEG